MKKKLFILLLILILPIMLFCGCDTRDIEVTDYSRFKHICCGEGCIIVDKETGVMYLWVSAVYKGGLTVMLNPDGTPMIWEE